MNRADEPWVTSWADLVSRQVYLRALTALFVLLWLLLALDPHDRSVWLAENVTLVVFVAALATTYRTLPLSRTSYSLIALYLLLHATGAHYTYSQVPWPEWLHSAAVDRNPFDRVVHFAYGLLLAYPFREVLLRLASPRGFWGYFFPVAVTLATSAVYELAEWGIAVVFGGDLGVAFLGNQGDEWDAQKDMALAGLGALVAMSIAGVLNYALERDFAREWNESLRVKVPTPLGEDELWRLWCARKRPALLNAGLPVSGAVRTRAGRTPRKGWPKRLLQAQRGARLRAARFGQRHLRRWF